MNIPNPVQTPVGGGATAAGMVTLIARVILPPVWPWWAHQASTWTGGVEAVVIFGLTYLGGWLNLVRTKGQKVTLGLTVSRLPTVQTEAAVPVVAEPAAAPAA